MKFSVKDFFSKYGQIRIFLRIWSHLLKKSIIENFIFCAVRTRGRVFINLRVFLPVSTIFKNGTSKIYGRQSLENLK